MSTPQPLSVPQLIELLGDDLFGRLLGAQGTHLLAHPDKTDLAPKTAGQVLFLSNVCVCLQGSYSVDGIRRWFDRQRPQLLRGETGNQIAVSPADILWHAQWSPAGAEEQAVLRLAQELAMVFDDETPDE